MHNLPSNIEWTGFVVHYSTCIKTHLLQACKQLVTGLLTSCNELCLHCLLKVVGTCLEYYHWYNYNNYKSYQAINHKEQFVCFSFTAPVKFFTKAMTPLNLLQFEWSLLPKCVDLERGRKTRVPRLKPLKHRRDQPRELPVSSLMEHTHTRLSLAFFIGERHIHANYLCHLKL